MADLLRTAARDGPADRVSGDAQDKSEGGAQRLLERQHRVCRHPGEQPACPLVPEPGGGQAAGRAQRLPAETRQDEGVTWQPRGPQHVGRELLPRGDQRLHQFAVRSRVTAERLTGLRDGAG